MSTLKVNTITNTSGNPDITNVGKNIKVAIVTKTDTFSASCSAGNFTNNCIELAYTPVSSSNKLLITAVVNIGCSTDNGLYARLTKGNSDVSGTVGDADGSRGRVASYGDIDGSAETATIVFRFLVDAGSAGTWGVQLRTNSSSTKTVYVNRHHTDNNNVYNSRQASTLSIEEIAT